MWTWYTLFVSHSLYIHTDIMDERRNILMDRYEIGRQLGQGNFAKVYYARNLTSGQGVAIKIIDKHKITRVGLIV